MIVVTLVLFAASMPTPIHNTRVVRARAAVLRDHHFTLRAFIDRFTLDIGALPPGSKSWPRKAIWGDCRPSPSHDQRYGIGNGE
jgi:hypothetical protein